MIENKLSGYEMQVIVTIVPAIILLVLYFWLRGREVRDQALLLLCLGLASWTAAGVLATPPLQEAVVLHVANWIVRQSCGSITFQCEEKEQGGSKADATECKTIAEQFSQREGIDTENVICRYRDKLTRISIVKTTKPKLKTRECVIIDRDIRLKEQQPSNALGVCSDIPKEPPTLQTIAAFLVSPINNILLGLAALYLTRFRRFVAKKFRRAPQKIRPAITFLRFLIVATSITPLILMLMPAVWLGWLGDKGLGLPLCGKLTMAMSVDVLASCLCIGLLAFGVGLSFWEYGIKPLASLGVIAFFFVILRQPIVLFTGSFSSKELIVFSAFGNACLGFILVALAMAWGLSGKSRLKIEASKTTGVLALVVDLRESTAWVRAVRNNLMVADFLNSFRDWILGTCRDTMSEYPEPLLVKFQGDGYLLVWEKDIRELGIRDAVNTARALVENYPRWKEQAEQSKNFLPGLPGAIGVGLDYGLALRLTYENGSYDYIGDSINCASKLQAEIRELQKKEKKLPEERLVGGVAISRNLRQLLRTDQRDLFEGLETSELACGAYIFLVRPETGDSPTDSP